MAQARLEAVIDSVKVAIMIGREAVIPVNTTPDK